jgi:hypothetical protein
VRLLVDAAIAPLSETWRDSVRNAADVEAPDGHWRESFAPCCFVRHGAGAEVQLGHDGQVVGHVTIVVRGRDVHVAEMIIEGDEQQLARVRVGQGVSIDAYSHTAERDRVAGTKRHELVTLHHVAIAADHETPYYPQAKILSVRKLGAAPAASTAGPPEWQSVLPRGFESFRDDPIDLQVGEALVIDATRTRPERAIYWTGSEFSTTPPALRAT